MTDEDVIEGGDQAEPWSFGGAPDIRSMQRLASDVWRLRPDLVNVGATVGELAWIWGCNSQFGPWFKRRFWTRGSDLVAFGWAWPPYPMRVSADRVETVPASLTWQVHPDRPELMDEVLAWFEEVVPDGPRDTHVRTADRHAITALERNGFEPQPGMPWHHMNVRSLAGLQDPALPDGFRFVTMQESGDVDAFVLGHRAAWESEDLTVEKYDVVMSMWPYRRELDVAVQAPDGRLVSRAIAWYDESNTIAELEPVGTDPNFRQRGIGAACNLFAMHQARAAGATSMMIGCRGDDNYPVPRKLYQSVGFEAISRDVAYRK